MTEEIREGIKKMKEINRKRRNCREEEKEENLKLYCQQKEIVKQMIRNEMGRSLIFLNYNYALINHLNKNI